MSLNDIALTTLSGDATSLADYAGRAVLVVNVASKCGLTPQYTALEQLREPERNIVTLEDPVERHLPGITQTNIDRARNLDYSRLLRSVLRQDPDVIMIGEIRDRDTAETVLTAAITGHLVLGTVHAANVFEVLKALEKAFIINLLANLR